MMSNNLLAEWIVNVTLATIVFSGIWWFLASRFQKKTHPAAPAKMRVPWWKLWNSHRKSFKILWMVPAEASDWYVLKAHAAIAGVSLAVYCGEILDSHAEGLKASDKIVGKIKSKQTSGNKPQQGGKPQAPQGGGNGRPPFIDE